MHSNLFELCTLLVVSLKITTSLKTLLKKSASTPKDVWNVLLSWLFTQQKDFAKALIQEKALFQRKQEDLSAIFTLGKTAFENSAFDTSNKCFNFIVEKSKTKSEG